MKKSNRCANWPCQMGSGSALFFLAFVSLGVGCGDGSTTNTTPEANYAVNVFEPPATFAAFCASPRSGIDPATGKPYPDRQGSTVLENFWLRSWTNWYYLWYSEVPDVNPAGHETLEYFDLMKTPKKTSTGRPKDRFHFTYGSAEWYALSQGGVSVGYGLSWAFISNRPPRKLLVALVEPTAPATTIAASIPRGASIVKVDGVDLANATGQENVDKLNAGLFPKAAGETHTFAIQDTPSSAERTVTLTSANVDSVPVQNVKTIVQTDGGVVGYILFNDHFATAEPLLVNAFNQLAAAHVTDLVLDLRYNGGGYLDLASEVAYMIAGSERTSNHIFEKQNFNDKYPTINPITGAALTAVPFHSESLGFTDALPSGQALPSLNLNRVFVLTTGDTCSASESIINGLKGVGVNVIQIGSTTCGKPYAFYPEDNCGTTYFSIQLVGVNDAGFGDYSDGFSPSNAPAKTNATLSGCFVPDDFTHALGDTAEGMFAAALQYRQNGSCPTPTASFYPGKSGFVKSTFMVKPEPLMNRILRRGDDRR